MSYQFITNTTIKERKEIQEEIERNEVTSYYFQVCAFKNKRDNRFHLRRFGINKNNEFATIREFYLNERQYKKFFDKKKMREYKVYPVFDFSTIEYPNLAEILVMNSNILSSSNTYSGYAPFG